MITHYYHCYDESVESLIGRIDTNQLYCSIGDNIIAENDVFLIHSIIRINSNKGIYRKCELKQIIWNMLFDKCVVDKEFPFSRKIENYKSGFDNLFDYCWRQKFSLHINGKGAKPLYKIVYRKMPLKRKLFDNNFSLAIYVILFLFLVFLIDKWTVQDNSWNWGGITINTHPIMITCAVLIAGTSMLCLGAKNPNQIVYSPLIACGLVFVSSIIMIILEPQQLIDDSELEMIEWSDLFVLKIQLIRRNVYLGLACLLLIPILRLNIQRLDDYSII